MKFSLIVPTIGRSLELRRLLDSLSAQTLQDFEVIISDQNKDDRVLEVLKDFNWGSKLIRVPSSGGASAARNAGLDIARGEVIGFPDDDSTLEPDLLARVASFFDTHPQYGYLTGCSHDESGRPLPHFCREPGPIQRKLIYRQMIEFTFFVRSKSLGSFRYDENMGVGCPTPWQADEGPDLVLRLEDANVHGFYTPEISIWHPQKVASYDATAMDRSYRYACGSGYFLRKHRYPLFFVFNLQARALGGAIVGLLKLNPRMARFYFTRWRGYIRGWFGHGASAQ